jgi:LysM repeat protein
MKIAPEIVAGLWLAMTPALIASPGVPGPAPRLLLTAGERSPETPAALLELSDEELLARIEADPSSLGSLSIGIARSSTLFNGVQLASSPRWSVAQAADAWGTTETLENIQTAIDTVCELYPDTPPITIGDISSAEGGHLKRHKSHQGGRDVDFGFYYTSGKGSWFVPGTKANLDLDRNWTLVRALVTRTDVETILLDTRIQRLLYQHALSLGEDKEWLDRIFGFARGSREAIIVHVAGHRTHYHVRFFNPIAQELGRRAHPLLVRLGMMTPSVYTVDHVARPGQTLGWIARNYGTSVRVIMQANGLRTSRLRVGQRYVIPRRGAAPPSPNAIVIPARKLPPATPPALLGVDWPTTETSSHHSSDGDR